MVGEPAPRVFKTVVVVTVLSEGRDASGLDLDEIAYETAQGRMVGATAVTDAAELTGAEAAALLTEMGSTPEFFGLDDDGEPLDL